MSGLKLYKELLKFIRNQKELIHSFTEREYSYDNIRKFKETLIENIEKLEEHIDKIIDGDDKD